MKRLFGFIVGVGCAIFAQGEQRWDMDMCMAFAAENASDVAQARLTAASAGVDREQALADFFPSISASTAAQFSWGRNIDPETNTYNNVTNFSNGYGAYVSFTLFDGGQTIYNWKRAVANMRRSNNAVVLARDERAIATMMAYIDALYYQGATEIAHEKMEQSQWVLTLTERQEELGIKALPDLMQAKAAFADDCYNSVRQQNLSAQAMLALRSGMNFPSDQTLEIDTLAFSGLPMPEADNADEIYSQALGYNPKALVAEMDVEAAKFNYRLAKGSLFPTISINAGISTSYYKTLTGAYGGPKFGSQFKNNLGEYVSATFSLPLFDNLSRSSNVKRARYSYEKAKVDRDEALRKLHDEIEAAVLDRNGYAMEAASLQAKTEAEAAAYRLNKRRYEEGLLTYIDLQLSANAYYASRLELLKTRMLYVLKKRLVDYYKGQPLY